MKIREETRIQENIRGAMERLGKRYVTSKIRCMAAGDQDRMRAWFVERYNYLQEAYRIAVNADDSLFGKQWAYDEFLKHSKFFEPVDHAIKLPRR